MASKSAFIGTGPKRGPSVNLFCFTHLGGASAKYLNWFKSSMNLNIVQIELPGHGIRYDEKPFTHIDDLTDYLLHTLLPWLAHPYMIFWHSLGGLIGYKLVSVLQQNGFHLPKVLAVSASLPPHQLQPPVIPTYSLSHVNHEEISGIWWY